MIGSSQYSRPTTAKKTFQSPKILKQKEAMGKIKTQQSVVELDKLYEFMQQTIGKQKQCESKGKYVEAEAFKRKVKALREQLEDRQMYQIKNRHQRQLQELEEAHQAEMNLFGLQWEKQIANFNQQIDKMLQEIANKHEAQIKQAEGQLEVQRKFHQSPKLLQLRRIEIELGKQQNYMQAHRIQQKANKLQQDEKQKHKQLINKKSKNSINLLKSKQEGEAEALKMRIRLQVEQKQRLRLKEEGQLLQKYENIKKQTQFQQNQELIKLNKTVKLNQLQKKSKVGMFSQSKEY